MYSCVYSSLFVKWQLTEKERIIKKKCHIQIAISGAYNCKRNPTNITTICYRAICYVLLTANVHIFSGYSHFIYWLNIAITWKKIFFKFVPVCSTNNLQMLLSSVINFRRNFAVPGMQLWGNWRIFGMCHCAYCIVFKVSAYSNKTRQKNRQSHLVNETRDS